MEKLPDNLIGNRRLARNVGWSLLGAGAPLIVAVIAIPKLLEGLGKPLFGVLTLAWMVVGYFSLFDLGLGRALTKLVAERLGLGRRDEVPALIRTALLLMAGLGVVGGLVVAVLSPWLVGSVLKIPVGLQAETLSSFYLLAFSVPIVIGTTGLRGILEAHQRFGLVNAVRIPLGIMTFLGPLAVLPFSHSLVPVVAILVCTRALSWLVYAALCLHVEPELRKPAGVQPDLIRPLVTFGGWMTVTNLVGPLMVYLDRFLIGAMVSMTFVAYYTTPYEVVTKLRIIPAALMRVLFPAFAMALGQDRILAERLFNRAVKYLFLLLFPMVLVIVTLADDGLGLWLGAEFATSSGQVLQWLAVGVFINSHAQLPFGFVQSAGHPEWTAKLHLVELPFYLLLLWWLLNIYGIVGAAIAWVARAAFDAVVLFAFARRLFCDTSRPGWRWPIVVGMSLLAMVVGAMLSGLVLKCVFLLSVLLVFGGLSWFYLLSANERVKLGNGLFTLFEKDEARKCRNDGK